MTISKLSDAITYSNKNIEKLAKKIINESSNAVLMEMFEDKVLLADHTNGNIYTADYSFDGNNFVFENFENVELENESSSLREAISNYFDDESVDVGEIEEAISEEFENENNEISNSITEALASKNIEDTINYSELDGINEELNELKETELYKVFTERLEEAPISTITKFNFVDPVKVSVIDEDTDRVIFTDIKGKIEKFKKDPAVKAALCEALQVSKMFEDDEKLNEFIENNDMILALNENELKEFVGMSVIAEPELLSERKEIAEKINKIIEENEYFSDKKNIINEAAEDSEADDEENKEDKKLAASDGDIEKLKKALETAAEKVTDDKLLTKINALISAIDDSAKDNETNVEAIKESIAILSL